MPRPNLVHHVLLGLLLTVFALVIASAADDPAWDGKFRTTRLKPSRPVAARGVIGQSLKNVKIDAARSIQLIDCQDVAIVGCELHSLHLSGCRRVRIVNCFIHDAPDPGIVLDGCQDVLVQGNRIERVSSGVYAHRSQGIQVIGNCAQDVQGPMPRGQMVQLNQVSGSGNAIVGNHAVNHHGRSRPEDVISLYKSVGTADSPIRVEDNYMAGDPTQGSAGLSESGSGIMLGDGGGQHIVCCGNIILSAGQVGIGVAGGSNITVEQNFNSTCRHILPRWNYLNVSAPCQCFGGRTGQDDGCCPSHSPNGTSPLVSKNRETADRSGRSHTAGRSLRRRRR